MKPYSVILSESGEVGYPKGFDTLTDAERYYNESGMGAILIKRNKRLHETIIAHRGLDSNQINSLMGYDYYHRVSEPIIVGL